MTPLPTQSTVITRTPRLTLRTWTERDLEPITAIWCDPESMRFVDPLPDLAAVRRALAAATRVQAERGICLWAIDETSTGRLIGDCGFHARSEPDAFELAYHLHPAVWGRGYATEAARAAIEYAFTHLAARRIVAWVDPQNPASAAVLRRCHFTEHGPDPDEHGEVRYELTR